MGTGREGLEWGWGREGEVQEGDRAGLRSEGKPGPSQAGRRSPNTHYPLVLGPEKQSGACPSRMVHGGERKGAVGGQSQQERGGRRGPGRGCKGRRPGAVSRRDRP